MKKIFFHIFFIVFLWGCTVYENESKIVIQDFSNLSSETINTNLKVANIILNQNEFEKMFAKFNKEIEIDGLLNLYKNGDTIIENEIIEVQLKGGFSKQYPLKSLGIKFKNPYNNANLKLIDTEYLDFHSLNKVLAVRFRNSGQDFENTMLKDISYTKLAIDAGLNIDLMYTEQTVVFINNVFLGIMNLRTESNTNGMAGLYNVDKSEITLAKINLQKGTVDKKDGDFNKIDQFINAIYNDDYNYVSQEIDINNFIDYMIFQSYIGNQDWPHNNVRFFAVGNGPFRFVLFDLDSVSELNIDEAPLSFINNGTDNLVSRLFNIMYANEDFKKAYNTRFKNLIASNVLSAPKFNEIVNEYKNNIEYNMPTHIDKYKNPSTYIDWYINIEFLKSNFEIREKYVRNHL